MKALNEKFYFILLKNPDLEGLRQEGIMTRYLLDLVRFDIVLFFGNSV